MVPVRTLRITFSQISAWAGTFSRSALSSSTGTVPRSIKRWVWQVRQYRWSSAAWPSISLPRSGAAAWEGPASANPPAANAATTTMPASHHELRLDACSIAIMLLCLPGLRDRS